MEVVWSGASRQVLCGALDRDYAAMQGDGWDVIYVPPSPVTTPWHPVSDAAFRRLYYEEGRKATQVYARRGAVVLPLHLQPKATGIMQLVLSALRAHRPRAMAIHQILEYVLAHGFTRRKSGSGQRVRNELYRLIKLGRALRIAPDQYTC